MWCCVLCGEPTRQVLLALADWGYLINLFNLLPVGAMDGGRVAGTLSPWLPAGGLALGGDPFSNGDGVLSTMGYYSMLACSTLPAPLLYFFLQNSQQHPWRAVFPGWIAYEGLVSNPIFYLILLSGGYTTGSRLLGYTEPPPEHEYRRLNGSEQVMLYIIE